MLRAALSKNGSSRLVRANSKVPVAVMINADALFVQIPKQFEPAFRRDGSAYDADAGFASGLKYGERHAVRPCITDTVHLMFKDSADQFLVGLLNEFDIASPRLGELFD